jgi:hypothetical protein
MIEKKRVDQLKVADLEAFPVWEYTNSDEEDNETMVRPVKLLPVSTMSGKLVGTLVTLANGMRVWALIGNVFSLRPEMTEHFLSMSIENQGHWFHLARYHEIGFTRRGPSSLASFLNLETNEVFPVAYDIRFAAKVDSTALRGEIKQEPSVRFSRSAIVDLAVQMSGDES